MDRSFFRFVIMHAFDRQTDRQTDRRTDRQTEFSSLDRVCIPCSAEKIYTISKSLVEVCLKLTKLCCFNQSNPHFSAFRAFSSQVVCWCYKKSRYASDEMRISLSIQTRWPELLQRLQLTTIGSHDLKSHRPA